MGYRWFVRRAAERLGLSGVARNLDDGGVEVLVQGDGRAIASLESELRRGPSMAQVQSVDKSELPHEVTLPKGFETD